MSPLGTFLADAILAGAIIALPTAVAAWLGSRVSSGPATRHLLWSAVLASFVAPAIGLPLLRAASHAAPIGLDAAVHSSRAFAPASNPRPSREAVPQTHPVAPPPGPGLPAPSVRVAKPAPTMWGPATATTRPSAAPAHAQIPASVPPARAEPASLPATPHPLAEVRRALISQGPLLLVLWAAGAAPMLVAILVASIGAHRLVRRATPAPADTLRLVHVATRAMGLRRQPRVYFTTQRVSPMLVCGVRPALILPVELWQRLEPHARLSIIVHELAHLRRRDHWLSWCFSIIVTIFWWHPVAWWALARTRDEAEEACDAWVTAVSPGSRRTYAEAIVATKELIGTCGEGVSPRLCVVSGGVLRLRRRITMVMTGRVSPRGSWAGIAAGTLLTLAGVLATPGLACPPEEQPAGEGAPTRAAFQGSAGMFSEQPDVADRLADMLARLDARLSAIEARLQSAPTTAPAIAVEGYPLVGSPRAISPFAAEGQPTQPALTATAEGAPAGPAPGSVSRTYTLSEGKLRALSDLMSRQDVPIWVTPGEDAIEVLATPQQHEIFAAFLGLIEPAAATRTVVGVPLQGGPVTVAGAPLPAGPRTLAERYLADAERSANLLAGQRSELNEQVRQVLAKQEAAAAGQKAEYEKAYLDLVAARASLEARLQEAQAAADAAKARLRDLEAERAALAPATPPSAPTAPAAPARPRGR